MNVVFNLLNSISKCFLVQLFTVLQVKAKNKNQKKRFRDENR